MMTTRLERDVDCRTLSRQATSAHVLQSHHLRMMRTHRLRSTPPKHLCIAYDDAPHARIG